LKVSRLVVLEEGIHGQGCDPRVQLSILPVIIAARHGSHHITLLIRSLTATAELHLTNERPQLGKARPAGLWLTLGRRGAVGGEGFGQRQLGRGGMHAESVGDLAAVDDEWFLELVLHLR
jgi:hypothetical protein